MNEFLKTEYEQCLMLLKYYDERHQSLVKFTSGLSSGVPSLLLAFYGLGGATVVHFWKFASLLSAMTAISLLAIFTVMVQVRLYFIYPARQVNAIRKAALEDVSELFTNNQMYLDTTFSAFKWASAHSLLNAFVALQIGAFVGLAIFGLYFESRDTDYLVLVSGGGSIATASIVFGLSAWYLHAKSKYQADRSIHGRIIKDEQSQNPDS